MADDQNKNWRDDTILTHAGLKPFENSGVINPPVYHASTVLFPTLEIYRNPSAHVKVTYGRHGTPTKQAFTEAMSALENAYDTMLTSSGMSAVALSIFAFTKANSHVLIPDSVYGPTRSFMSAFLKKYNVEVEYYDPTIGADIISHFKENTVVLFMESPGSWTFEMQDIPAMINAAKQHNIISVVDNTWSGGYFFKPLDHGADVSVQAATKYVVGHSDTMMGTIACTEKAYKKVAEAAYLIGNSVAPDDIYLASRGMKTMGVRLRQHHKNGLKMAEWLSQRPEVLKIFHPARPDHPGHEIWKRDFTGASGLFAFSLDCPSEKALAAMMDHMKYFGMGFSWGGFESLLIPTQPETIRTATTWNEPGQMMRIHVGLEDLEDLIEDLEAGFERMNAAS